MIFEVQEFKDNFNVNEENYVLVIYSNDDPKHKHPYYIGYSTVLDKYLSVGDISQATIFNSLTEIKSFSRFWISPDTAFYKRLYDDGFDLTNIYIVELKPSLTHRIVFKECNEV